MGLMDYFSFDFSDSNCRAWSAPAAGETKFNARKAFETGKARGVVRSGESRKEDLSLKDCAFQIPPATVGVRTNAAACKLRIASVVRAGYPASVTVDAKRLGSPFIASL